MKRPLSRESRASTNKTDPAEPLPPDERTLTGAVNFLGDFHLDLLVEVHVGGAVPAA